MASVFAVENKSSEGRRHVDLPRREGVLDSSPAALSRSAAATATVDIVVPVYNEERVLEANIRRLRSYLDSRFPFSALVTVADNASTDGTWDVASRLAAQVPGVRAVHLDQKGRGRALRAVWSTSPSAVVAYMDVDLATDLDGLLPLVAPLLSGHSDIAIGTRLAHGARVRRGTKREVISRSYNLIVRTTMRTGVTDVQCGFKAMRTEAAAALLPLVVDEGWFFDTELLILGEANGMRIHEVPVDWDDDHDSRVKVVSTAMGDMRGLLRVSRGLATGRCRTGTAAARSLACQTRFGGIGGLSTIVYLGLFLGLVGPLGALRGNLLALTVAAAGNTAAHRRFTLPAPGSDDPSDQNIQHAFLREAVVALAAGLAMSSALLAAVSTLSTDITAQLAAVIAANAVVSACRFVSFRARMFRAAREGRGL